MLKKYIEQVSHIGWISLMVGLPISKAAASVALTALVILGIAKLFSQQKPNNEFDYRPIWALSALFFAYIIGCFYSTDIGQAITFLYRANGLWMSPLAVMLHTQLIATHYRLYLKALIVGTILACLATLLLYAMPESRVIYYIEQSNGILSPYSNTANRLSFGLYSPFIDRLQFGNLIGISILAVVWLWGETETRKQYFYAFGSLVILFITHLFLGARSAQLGTLLGLALLVSSVLVQNIRQQLKNKVSKTFVVLTTTVFVLSFTLFLAYMAYHFVAPVQMRYHQLQWEMDMFLNHDFKSASYEHFTSLRRIVSWLNSWTLIKQYPIMGVGTGDYYTELDRIYAADNLALPLNSHSQYLQIWATVGLWGLSVFIGSLLYWLYALKQRADRWLFCFGCSILLLYSLVFLFDAILLRQIDNITFPAILGIIYTISYRKLTKTKTLGAVSPPEATKNLH